MLHARMPLSVQRAVPVHACVLLTWPTGKLSLRLPSHKLKLRLVPRRGRPAAALRRCVVAVTAAPTVTWIGSIGLSRARSYEPSSYRLPPGSWKKLLHPGIRVGIFFRNFLYAISGEYPRGYWPEIGLR